MNWWVKEIASLIVISIVITSFAIGLKTFAITARINKYMSIIKKKKNKHDKIVLLAKSKLNSIKVLTSKALIDWNISHDEFVLINNVQREYDEWNTKWEILKLKQLIEDFSLFIKQCYHTVWGVEKIQKVEIQKLQQQKMQQ